jgi:hypothetical protein
MLSTLSQRRDVELLEIENQLLEEYITQVRTCVLGHSLESHQHC